MIHISDIKVEGFEGPYNFLSNFSEYGFEFRGIYYPTNEHFFQAMKTLDLNKRKYISNLDSPGEAKKIGRQVKLRDDWDDGLKHDVMKKGLYEKFTQNPELTQRLLDTGDAYLEETNFWGDDYWGNATNTDKEGKNHLGKHLMDLRIHLQAREEFAGTQERSA